MASTSIRLPMQGSGGGGGTTDTTLRGKYVRSTRFEIISSGTSGSIAGSLPPASTIILDGFGGTTDAVITKVQSSLPMVQSAITSTGAIVATSFDSSGNWVLTGTPSAYPVAIIYKVQQTWENFDSTASNIITFDDSLSAEVAMKRNKLVANRNPDLLFEDFEGVAKYNALTGSAGALNNQAGVGTTNQVGWIRVRVSTNGGHAGYFAAINSVLFGTAEWIAECGFRFFSLPDGTDNYTLRFGFGDSASASDFVDGAYFEYDPAVSDNWLICTSTAGTRTKTTSLIAANVTTYQKLFVDVNSDATLVSYYVNDVLAGTVSTNIPTGTNYTGYQFQMAKTLGSGIKDTYLDYLMHGPEWTTGTRY